MKHKIFTLYEYFPGENSKGEYVDEKRRIYTFYKYNAAYEVMLCIQKNDELDRAIGIEEHEITT